MGIVNKKILMGKTYFPQSKSDRRSAILSLRLDSQHTREALGSGSVSGSPVIRKLTRCLEFYRCSMSDSAIWHNQAPISTCDSKGAHAKPFLFRPKRLHGIDGGRAPCRHKSRHKAAHHQ